MKLKKQFNKKIIYSINSDKVFKICNNEITNYLHFLIFFYKKESFIRTILYRISIYLSIFKGLNLKSRSFTKIEAYSFA